MAFADAPKRWDAFLMPRTSENLQNGKKTIMNAHPPGPRPSFVGRPKQWTSRPGHPQPKSSQNARSNYERYLALARAEAQNGNAVAAENHYQHAEHYFRSMSSGSEEQG